MTRLTPRHRLEFLAAALTGLLALLPPAALARSSDREQPLDVIADGLDGPIAQSGDTELRNVVITQGSLRIDAARAVVTRRDGEVTRVLLTGTPAALQQENDDGRMMRAQARRIDYDTGSEQVVLSGAVRIEQGRDLFRGERVNYDTRSGHITGDGGQGGRIHLTIQPKRPPESTPKDG